MNAKRLKNKQVFYTHKNLVYTWIWSIWLVLMLCYGYFIFHDGIFVTYHSGKHIMAYLEAFNFLIFTSLFFWFSIQNLVFPCIYQYIKMPEARKEQKILNKPLPKWWNPKVDLLYSTCNDFIPSALDECSKQTWKNIHVVILDNSTDKSKIDEIRQYVKTHPNTEWIRDTHNHHAKAGNLDNFLCHKNQNTLHNLRNLNNNNIYINVNNKDHPDYDYFVVLDSDELLQPDFVEKCLHFFYYSHHLGILQCNHTSGRNINAFMDMFARTANSFWPVQNAVRSAENGYVRPKDKKHKKAKRIVNGDCLDIGLGHGVMISKNCFNSVGKFPYMVAEDLSFSLEAILKGWNIKFATQIYGNEEFPINEKALMIRSSKFCRSDLQFLRVYFKRLMTTKMLTIRQKIDLLSFTLSIPIFALMYLSLILCSIIFPLDNVSMGYNWLMLAPTLICYFSQTIADGVFKHQDNMNLWDVIHYEFEAMLLYGSFYFITVKCIIQALFGKKAKFNVTPKSEKKIIVKDAFMDNIGSIIFSLVTIIVAIFCSGSNWVLLSFLPGCFGWLIALKANSMSKKDKKKQKRFSLYDRVALFSKDYDPLKWYE